MGDTPLRLDSANDGNLKQMSTAEENYLAYHAGLHLSVLDSSDVATITTTSSGNSLVGTFTDTTFGGSAATPSDDSDDFYGYANPAGSGVVTEAAANGTVPTADTHGLKQYASDGVTPAAGYGNSFGIYWDGTNFGTAVGVDSSGWARSTDGFTYFIDADSPGASFTDYTLGNGNILKYFAIRRTLTNPITGAVGEHGFAGGNVPITQTITSLYQREGVTDWAGDSAERRYPIEFVDNSGDAEIHEFDSSELDTISDRLIGRIMTSEYPGTYRLGTSAPSGDYSVYKSGVFEDRLQTGVSGTVYNLYVRSSMTAPATSRTVGIKRASGATGTFQGLQEMTDAQIRYSFGARAQSRIMNGNYGVGTYLLRSSAQGAPTETGTWAARGTATDTRRDVSDVDYTRTSTRTSGGTFSRNFEGNYSRVTSTTAFTRNSTNVFTNNFTTNFTGNYTRVTSTRTSTRDSTTDFVGDYLGNYSRVTSTRTSTRNSVVDFLGNYVGNFVGNYSRVTSTRTSTRNSVVDFLGNYVGNFVGNYARAYQRTRATDYIGDYVGNYLRSVTYQGNFAGNYLGDYGVYGYQRTSTRTSVVNFVGTAEYVQLFTGDYVGNFLGNYSRAFTRTRATDYVGDYVGDFSGNFAGNFSRAYTRTRATDYVGDYVGDFAGNFAGNFSRAYEGNYGGNYVGNFAGNFAGNFSRAYTRNFTGDFTRNFTGDFTGNYARDFTTASTRTRTSNYGTSFAGNFLGNYLGSTIGSGTSTIETYTLYVRTA